MYTEIPYQSALAFCRAVFESYGFGAKESLTITDVLLRADLYGIESHGVQRLVRYHKEIGCGMVDVHAQPETVFETPLTGVVDAKKAMGQLVAVQAMEMAIEKATKTGMGMVTVRNSNHYGIAGYYADMAVRKDLIGLCMTNSEAICVPTFGKMAMLGTNPIALGMPAKPWPFAFDAATTVVPRGKLEVYVKNEKPLPEQWAIDAQGHPTTNGGEVLANIIAKAGGGIAPLGGSGELHGGHKGYGLAAMVDIFTAVLSGGMTSNHVNIMPGQTDICHCFTAIDYGLFGDKAAIRARLSAFLQELRDSDKADGCERIYTHGEKEAIRMAQRQDGSFPVNDKTVSEMRAIAQQQGLSFGRFFPTLTTHTTQE